MPRLTAILVCENIIIANDKKVSLLSLIDNLSVGLPANAPIQPNATIPMKWYALCAFERQEGEENSEFETYVELDPIRSAFAKFRFGNSKTHRVLHQFMQFPLHLGELRVKAMIGPVGGQFAEVGSCPFVIQATPQGPPPETVN